MRQQVNILYRNKKTTDDNYLDYDNEAFDGTEIADAKLHNVETKSQVNGLTFSEDTKLPSKANIKENEVNFKRFGKGLAMSVAYGATSGGIATLTGTPPNIILQGQADRYRIIHVLISICYHI